MAKTKQVTEKATEQTKKEFTLEQVFAMWKKTSKKGETYFTGAYYGEEYYATDLRAFYNSKKKNPNEPDVKIYTVNNQGNISKEPIISLWCNATESGKKYLSGKIGEKRVVGFINEKANSENRQPYFSVYYSEDKPEEKPKAKQTKMEEVTGDDLPF